MTRSFRLTCAAFTVSSFVSLGLSGQVARRLGQQSQNDTAREVLAGSVSTRVATAERLGALPGDTKLNGLSLILRPTDAQDAALTQLLADQQNPSKPDYHHWLTPQQFGERFGLAEEDLAVLRSWLDQAGLRVDEVAASRNSIRFSGAATDVAAAFGTAFGQYREGGKSFHENSVPVQLPKGFAAVIQGISGLSNYRLTPQNVRMSAQQLAAGPPLTGSKGWASPQYTTANTSGTVHYLVPWDFRQIYGINTLIHSGFDGTGVKIGVIGQSAVDTQQLSY
ncbi:MAG: protease pro-enzyme activation domain-containing protein, partial [Janthinobacterium lividum]